LAAAVAVTAAAVVVHKTVKLDFSL
jgi:hypothetical protein